MIERTYKISDVVGEQFMRFPLSLLANPQYRQMSLEAKFVYALLLNRLGLSQKNRWVNEEKEVYLIYTREEAAATLNISYRKAIAAFKELIENGLLYEQRQGRGYPNLLYVLKAELDDGDAEAFSEEYADENEPGSAGETTETPENTQMCGFGISRTAISAVQELQKPQVLNGQNGTSRPAKTAYPDLPFLHPRKTENKNTEMSYTENSPSVRPPGVLPGSKAGMTDGPTAEEQALEEIFAACSFELFQPHIRQMFRQVIDRMYFSDGLRVGDARLPRAKVRSYLRLLDYEVLTTALERMKNNEERIVNPTAYLMSVLLNGICEKESDLILSLPPDQQKPEDFYLHMSRQNDEEGEDGDVL